VSAHRAAWALRAGLTAALVAGLVAVAATPAHAEPKLQIDNISRVDLQVGGGSKTVNLRLQNQAQGNAEENTATEVALTLTTPLDHRGVHIASAASGCTLTNNNTRMECNIGDIPGGSEWTGVVQLAVHGNSNLPPGQTDEGPAQIAVSSTNTSVSPRNFTVRLQGPEQAPTVTEVSGTLVDVDTGEPIPNATVILIDGAEVMHEVGTNADGEFRFRDMDIAPGSMGLRARKEGYDGETFTFRAGANERVQGVRLVAKSTATPSPTATPSASASPSPSASASATAAPAVDTQASGGTFFTTLMVILGVILVLAGIGAIVFMVWRRRQEDDDEGYDDADDPISGPRPLPAGPGGYRPTPTRVAGDAPTQIVRPGGGPPLPAVGPRPALADAPTMLHGVAGADQTTVLPRQGPPSPHRPGSGAPAPRPPVPGYGQPGYGSPAAPASSDSYSGGYGSPAAPASGGYASGYGSPAASGTPSRHSGPTAGYGNPAGSSQGYAADQPTYGGYGSEQSTGRHVQGGYGYDRPEPASGGGYGPDPYTRPASGGGYGQAGHSESSYGQPGYEQPGYGQAGYGQAGYDQSSYRQPGYGQSGHDQSGYGQAGYNGAASGGYQGGYQQGDYGSPPAYPPQPAQPPKPTPGQSGYGSDYYDESGQTRPRHSEPPDRRRLDWLDN
jgi:hypothetical protein